jgi:hypothetical protein
MESKVIWSRKSEENLERIFQFIAQDSEVYARIFVQNLILHVEKYFNSKITITGRIVPEFEHSALSFLTENILTCVVSGWKIRGAGKSNNLFWTGLYCSKCCI